MTSTFLGAHLRGSVSQISASAMFLPPPVRVSRSRLARTPGSQSRQCRSALHIALLTMASTACGDEVCGTYDALGHHDRQGSDMPSGDPAKPWGAIKMADDPDACAQICCEYKEGTVEGDGPCVGFLWILPADAPFCSSQAPVNCGPAGGPCPAWKGGCCFLKKPPLPPETPHSAPSITCGSVKHQNTLMLGWVFISLLLVIGGGYVVGGVVLSSRAGTGKLVLQSHPHYGTWVQLRGLVEDGIAYTRTRGGGGGRGVGSEVALLRASGSVAPPAGRGSSSDNGKAKRGSSKKSKEKVKGNSKGKSNSKSEHDRSDGSKSKASAGKISEPAGGSTPAAQPNPHNEAEAKVVARLLREQRDENAHSSQQKIKVVGLNDS